MHEKFPAPCEHCRASGLFAGHECEECGGKRVPHSHQRERNIDQQDYAATNKTAEPISKT